jgi:hypothetical protein
MNDNENELERALRSQRGPREDGYTPAALPMAPDVNPAGGAGPSRLARAGLFVGFGVAGALAVAAVAAILAGPGSGPDVGSGSSTEPSESVAQSAPACGPADVTLTGEPWGGAAGSRGTTVTVTLASGRYDCTLAPVSGAQITGAGSVGVTVGSAFASEADLGPSVALTADAAYTVGVAWSNWCGTSVSEPVTLALSFHGWPEPRPVAVASGGIDPVPPCSGGGETNLSVTDLQPAP